MPSILNATTTTGLVSSGDNSGSLQLATNNGTAALTIDTSQNVGIGTASPDTTLTVQATGANGINLKESLSNSTLSTRLFLSNATAGQSVALYNNAGNLLFTTGATPSSGSGTERMRIDSSGNLGIGTSSPQMRVDVSGGVRVQSIANPSSGSGMELAYDGTQGIIQAYSNRATLASVPVYLVTGQLKFPPTQNASSDANTLDDYEEGTWTPTLRGSGGTAGSYAQSQSGNYVKIGKLVWIWGNVTISNKGSWTGTVYFSLPFNVDTAFGTGAVRSQLHTFSGNLVCEWSTADAVTARFNVTASGGNQNNLDWSGMSQSVGNFMSFSLVYQATA